MQIIKVEPKDEIHFFKLVEADPVMGTKIRSVYDAYHDKTGLASFYYCAGILLCRFGSGLLIAHNEAQIEKDAPDCIAEFIRFTNPASVLAQGQIANALEAVLTSENGFPVQISHGFSMRLDTPATEPACPDGFSLQTRPPLKEAYSTLAAVHPAIAEAGYNAFCSDITMRMRYCGAFIYGVFESNGSACAATVCVLSLAVKSAVLSGISTLPAYRGKNLASFAISMAAQALLESGRTPYLQCGNERAKALYERIGFYQTGTFTEFTLAW